MITWMQKHKKWLVITIWISAIAFIGAGSVNWGSYGFGFGSDKVASVGDIDIHIDEYQRVYNQVLNEYAKIPQLGGILDEAQAKQLGIPQIALQRIIQQAQIRNFAQDLGLMVSDEEVGREILNANVYVDEKGNFSHEVYERALQSMQISKSDFEEMLRNEMLVQKLLGVVNANQMGMLISVTPLEVATLEMSSSVRDRLMVKSLPITQVKFTANEADIRAFWEQNAQNWKTPMEFEIEYILVPFNAYTPDDEALKKHYDDFKSDYIDDSGHLMSLEESREKLVRDVQKIEAESAAKREYINLKNSSKKGEIITIKDNERFFVKDGIDLVVADMKAAQVGQVLKPIEASEGFVTLRLMSKKESANQSFEEAKSAVKALYERNKRKEALAELAQKSVANFSGSDIGFVDRFYNGAILTLNEQERGYFISQVFESKNKQGYVLFDDKAVLYRILEQSATPLVQNNEALMLAKGAKYEALLNALADYLNKTYKTTIYIDVSK